YLLFPFRLLFLFLLLHFVLDQLSHYFLLLLLLIFLLGLTKLLLLLLVLLRLFLLLFHFSLLLKILTSFFPLRIFYFKTQKNRKKNLSFLIGFFPVYISLFHLIFLVFQLFLQAFYYLVNIKCVCVYSLKAYSHFVFHCFSPYYFFFF